MRSYFLPLLALLGLALLGAVIAFYSFRNAARLQREVMAERQSVEAIRGQNEALKVRLKDLREESKPADRLIKDWQGAFLNNDDAKRAILPAMDSLAVDNTVYSSQKQTHTDTGYAFQNKTISVENVEITVSGDYYRLLNWLGAVEQQFPLARVESVNFTNVDGLKLSATFSFPSYFSVPSGSNDISQSKP